MSELSQIREMISSHIEKTGNDVTEIKQSLARIEVHQGNHKEKLDSHGKDIEKLKWWNRGAIAAALTAIASFFK